VLGCEAGNALEVGAIIDLLCGRPVCPRLRELTLALSAELLRLGGLAANRDAALARLERALDSGAAAERFARMVAALGGPTDLLEHPARHLPRAPVQHAVCADTVGIIEAVDVRSLGECVVDLGGGRRRPDGAIDHAVGLAGVRRRGERVARGDVLAIVHARNTADAKAAAARVRAACCLGTQVPPALDLYRWLADAAVTA
jgi:thymidine phosphorylase